MKAFIDVSRRIGRDIVYVQGPAGNTSLKTGDRMLIKASGAFLKDMSEHSGYVECVLDPIREFLADSSCESADNGETDLNRIIEQSTCGRCEAGIASIETGMHAMLPSCFVLHTHSVYLNVATCMEGGKSVLREALGVPFVYIPYVNPGFSLSRAIARAVVEQGCGLPSILLLENHGLTVHGDDPFLAFELTQILTKRMVDFLKMQNVFEIFAVRDVRIDLEHHLFPDSAVFAGIDPTDLVPEKRRAYFETASAAAYIQEMIERLDGKARFLPQEEVLYIQNMEREKRRRLSFQQKI